jgi:hypothetical protein
MSWTISTLGTIDFPVYHKSFTEPRELANTVKRMVYFSQMLTPDRWTATFNNDGANDMWTRYTRTYLMLPRGTRA